MHPPGLARDICAMPTAWSNRRLVKLTTAHAATATNFYFANDKLNLRTQDAVTSICHRGPRSFATHLLCNVIKLCGEFQEAARSLKQSLDKPSDVQKRRQKSQLFATFLGRSVFNEFSYLKPALLTCVYYIHKASGKSSSSSQIDIHIVRCAVKVDPQLLATFGSAFSHFAAAAVSRALRF
jgi:hypothetical protein